MTPPRARLIHLISRAESMATAMVPARALPPFWPTPQAVKSVAGYVNDYKVAFSRVVVNGINGDADARQMAGDMRRLLRDYAEATFVEGMLEKGDFENEAEAREAIEDKDEQAIESWLTTQRGAVAGYCSDIQAVYKASDYPDNKQAQQGVLDRVGVWADSLRNLGDLGRLAGAGNIPLLFDGDDGDESCVECQRYKGQVHRRSWWDARGLLTRNGNPNFTCGRWGPCNHHFYAVTRNGKRGEIVVN